MKRFRWEVLLGIFLLILSATVYYVHYMVFRDPHHIFIYLLGDVAFVPIEVLLVTMIIHKLLEEREKRTKFNKLNMVIETFYSEVGTRLLAWLSDLDPELEIIRDDLVVTKDFSERDFKKLNKRFEKHTFTVRIRVEELQEYRDWLLEKRSFLLRLLQNPLLLEHETFTNLLRAVFHLTEELAKRDFSGKIPQKDLEHLKGDMERVYGSLVRQWIDYMKYLKADYPYLFSLAARTNPFDAKASVTVR